MATEREKRKFKAKICEHTERYEDMVAEMKQLIKGTIKEEPLDEEERNLLSVAYKNVVGSRRSQWRVLSSKSGDDLKESQLKAVEKMKVKVEHELKEKCGEVLQLLNDHLINSTDNVPAKIFFLKMKGDYHRYMIEICPDGSEKEELSKKANGAYQEALNIAKDKLAPTSPVRLGLALNYSVFFYEIKNSPNEACDLAKSAFDEAIADLEGVSEDEYKDSTLIMQLLRDNLTLWKSELDEDEDQDDD